jgi:hypothetical protein
MTVRSVWRIVKEFLFTKTSKEFLTFLFFLALSGVFWLSLTLNETYERDFTVPVSVIGVPKNAVLTSDDVDTVRVTIRDKGIVLMTYEYGDALKHIELPFRNYTHNNGTGLIPASEIQKRIYQNLVSSSKSTSIKPEKMEFYYSYGTKKQVPVRWSGRVIPEELYFISRVSYTPDSVTIFASREKLDSIDAVYTETLDYTEVRDTLTVRPKLRRIAGVKMVPEDVTVSFRLDVLTEASIEGIPITGINMPEGKVLRTFPAKVRVTFVTGANLYRNISPNDFEVVANYNEISNNPSSKCHISLRRAPDSITRARLDTTQVEYLIEE